MRKVLSHSKIYLLLTCISTSIALRAGVELPREPFAKSIMHAELIFTGTVMSVDTKKFTSPEGSSSPFTYVTYAITEILKGAVESQYITLRFFGGPISDTRYILTEGAPLFDVGDVDTLLVRGNGISDCPLIGCSAGRFRLIDENYYSESGRKLKIMDGHLREGDQVMLEQVTHHTMSPTISLIIEPSIIGQSIAFSDSGSANDQSSAASIFRYLLIDAIKRNKDMHGISYFKITRSVNSDAFARSSRRRPIIMP